MFRYSLFASFCNSKLLFANLLLSLQFYLLWYSLSYDFLLIFAGWLPKFAAIRFFLLILFLLVNGCSDGESLLILRHNNDQDLENHLLSSSRFRGILISYILSINPVRQQLDKTDDRFLRASALVLISWSKNEQIPHGRSSIWYIFFRFASDLI